MTFPRRWLDDPEADAGLREVLGRAPSARGLDQVTRRRLKGRIAKAAALPVVAAGWVFVKSAAAALGVVVGTAAVGVATGVVEVGSGPAPTEAAKPAVKAPARAPTPARAPSATPLPEAAELPVNPEPSLPLQPAAAATVATSASSLAAEASLLEDARRKLRVEPSAALRLAEEHARRFPKGQLTSERALIQIDALHRLQRDGEARSLARTLLSGAGGGLYAERVRQLLGEDVQR